MLKLFNRSELTNGAMSHQQAVLIVEDDPPTLALYQRALSSRYQVYACADAATALVLIQQQRIDAVVLEPSLPDGRGWELLATLRGTATTRALPIVLCSTLNVQRRASLLGATVYLVKPVLPTTLLTVLHQLLVSAQQITGLPG
jgi:DNA-binding response OmpR family regulator